ncbi:MAG: hypothetical protein ACLP1D_21080 [Xanthobacteraceae bacterium]
MARRLAPGIWAATALAAAGLGASPAGAEAPVVNTLAQLFARLAACWKPPPPRIGDDGLQITVVLSFRRDGSLLGKPSIAYETPAATDDDRIRYETALARTLQRCTPMPFTDEMGAAVAGRPLRIRFDASARFRSS